jgi:hypothetical protein
MSDDGLQGQFLIGTARNRDEAERFAATHARVPCWSFPEPAGYAQVELAEAATGTQILMRAQPGAGAEVAASALRDGWAGRGQGLSGLSAAVGDAGIARPPIGAVPTASINSYGRWSWGDRYVPAMLMYMFDIDLVAQMLSEHGRLFALSHAGHGANSYGLNLVTSKGPVAAFVQHLWGGVYTDPLRSLIHINTTYSRLHVLFEGVPGSRRDQPARWLLVFSEFRSDCGIVDLDRVRENSSASAATERFSGEAELFEAAAARLNG